MLSGPAQPRREPFSLNLISDLSSFSSSQDTDQWNPSSQTDVHGFWSTSADLKPDLKS